MARERAAPRAAGTGDGPSSSASPQEAAEFRDAPVVLENEFARVVLSIDLAGNAPRLKVEALETGQVAFFDALSLERLAALSQDELSLLFRTGAYSSSAGAKGGSRSG